MQRQVGYIMLVVVLGLIALGVIMLLSTSARLVSMDETDVYANLRRQGVWLVLGGIACVVLSRCDYRWLTRHANLGVAASIGLMLLCFAPYIGRTVNKGHRWIGFGPFNMQPSELAKFAFILFLAGWLARYQRQCREFFKGFAVPATVAGVMVLILVKQNDLGSAVILILLFVIVMFCAGTPKRYLILPPVVGAVAIFIVVMHSPYHLHKLQAFFYPEQHGSDSGYQVKQALIALGSGGPMGLGLGSSRQKFNFLPEAPTDFIFPILGEELGMWIALIVVGCYLMLTICGGWITIHAPDPAGVFLGLGVTSIIALQALINLAVVTQLVPNKGLPLPFISYGGSNLLLCLTCVGLLFSLHRHGIEVDENPSRLPRRLTPRM